MAPKSRYAVAAIAAVCLLVLLASPVNACTCTRGWVSYRPWAPCYYNGPATSGSYAQIYYSSSTWYPIQCQRRAGQVNNNYYWNRISYNNRNCWINDWYMTTGCADRCTNLGLC